MIRTLAVAGYRSVRELVLPLGALTVITGANGSGKSNVYRALRLLADIAQGQALRSLAREGGLGSALWAGPEQLGGSVRRGEAKIQGTRRKHPVALKLGFGGDLLGYSAELGLPPPSETLFTEDPEIKRECIWSGEIFRPASHLVDRRGPVVRARAGSAWDIVATELDTFDSMMTHALDPQRAPEILGLREHLRSWRFYDQLRTDADAPARRAQPGTRTPVLASDGADLAAALQHHPRDR